MRIDIQTDIKKLRAIRARSFLPQRVAITAARNELRDSLTVSNYISRSHQDPERSQVWVWVCITVSAHIQMKSDLSGGDDDFL